ncbi:MAG: hypothetical protein ICV73_20045 [Acetobacteraceae bacterium]|nr:hypothetical protein [Acetobacteraceae bacterium]
MTETAAAAAMPRPTVPVAEVAPLILQRGGTTDADLRTALRFVLGRPGWRVEARTTTQGGTHLSLTTPCPRTGGQRSWRLVRTRGGLSVHDEASGQRLRAVPTMRDALVEVWEAVTDAGPE